MTFEAVRMLEPSIAELIEAAEQRAAAEVEADTMRQLERAFRDVPRLAPEYDFFAVRSAKAARFARAVPGEAGDSAAPARSGIPEPTLVDAPTSAWRSRMVDGRWEVNSGHPDFRLAAQSGKRKLRYLAALLAKEVVLHSFPGPQLAPVLERLVSVLTITERRLER